MNTSEVLDKAADEIQRRGWVQGGYDDALGLCLESALSLAHDGTVGAAAWEVANTCPAGLAVRSYLQLGAEWRHSCSDSLWNWNDCRDTSSEVIEVLRAAAMVERTREAAEQVAEVSA